MQTEFVVEPKNLAPTIDAQAPVCLNCDPAGGGRRSRKHLGVDYLMATFRDNIGV